MKGDGKQDKGQNKEREEKQEKRREERQGQHAKRDAKNAKGESKQGSKQGKAIDDVWGETRGRKTPRKWTWEVYTIAFIITIVVFLAGAAVSYLFLNSALSPIEKKMSVLNDDIISLETVLTSASREDFCTLYPLAAPSLEGQTWQIGEQLEYFEESKKSFDIHLKYKYFHLEYRDLILLKKARALCNLSTPYIIYIYSNKEGTCPKCKDEGLELWKLRQALNGSIRIYSFDGSLTDDIVIKALKLRYNFTRYPTLILSTAPGKQGSKAEKSETVIEGFASKDELLQALGLELHYASRKSQTTQSTTNESSPCQNTHNTAGKDNASEAEGSGSICALPS